MFDIKMSHSVVWCCCRLDMVKMLTSDEDKTKYQRYLLRSYIEDNRKTNWCPAPGCDCAIEFDLGSGSYVVTCHCSHSFCWNEGPRTMVGIDYIGGNRQRKALAKPKA
ncbi:putative IBR domain, E3 ubiquitin ligase RBR family, TRIAD supradomain-containing protein [Helianthus annuus]|nr:putative IBR domain, E3 ubiquitin ligase RBR family, TRIAD supradomain-containing protein [Helianthus annuus]